MIRKANTSSDGALSRFSAPLPAYTVPAIGTRIPVPEPVYRPIWPTRVRDFLRRCPLTAPGTRCRRKQGRALVQRALEQSDWTRPDVSISAWKPIVSFCNGNRRLLKHLINEPTHCGKSALRQLVDAQDANALSLLQRHLPESYSYDRDTLAVDACYIGNWLPKGYGVVNYDNGDRFAGQTCFEHPHGPGIYTRANGRQSLVVIGGGNFTAAH